jgi:hypothetical protein
MWPVLATYPSAEGSLRIWGSRKARGDSGCATRRRSAPGKGQRRRPGARSHRAHVCPRGVAHSGSSRCDIPRCRELIGRTGRCATRIYALAVRGPPEVSEIDRQEITPRPITDDHLRGLDGVVHGREDGGDLSLLGQVRLASRGFAVVLQPGRDNGGEQRPRDRRDPEQPELLEPSPPRRSQGRCCARGLQRGS